MRPTRILRSGVDFIVKENARIISLNRPKALNALNHPMVKEMRPKLEQWKEREIQGHYENDYGQRYPDRYPSVRDSEILNLVNVILFSQYKLFS